MVHSQPDMKFRCVWKPAIPTIGNIMQYPNEDTMGLIHTLQVPYPNREERLMAEELPPSGPILEWYTGLDGSTNTLRYTNMAMKHKPYDVCFPSLKPPFRLDFSGVFGCPVLPFSDGYSQFSTATALKKLFFFDLEGSTRESTVSK